MSKKMTSYPFQQVVAYRRSDRGIGFQNQLIYKLEKDMFHFKALTRHHIVLMGRKTYESLGGKPLPDRVNVVLSKSLVKVNPGFELFSNLDAAIQWCKTRHINRQVFVIGGEQIYRETLPWTRMVYATEIVDDDTSKTPADCFYPDLTDDFPRKCNIVRQVYSHDKLSGREYEYSIVAYSRDRFI